MNYTLHNQGSGAGQASSLAAVRKLWPFLAEEKKTLAYAGLAIFINAGLSLVAPLVIAHVIDTDIQRKNFSGVLWYALILLAMYLVSLATSYAQTKLMGGVGQRLLFRLRNAVFVKLQELPVAFFYQNKAGDLISRINNDTDKLNQFFSQALMQFMNNIFIMIGAGLFLLAIHFRLGLAALAPAIALIVLTQFTSAWVRQKNARNMQALGGMSAEIQESLQNFKAIVAFQRRDYFRERFQQANEENYRTALVAGAVNNLYPPFYYLAAHLGQAVVLAYGIFLVMQGRFTLGLLIGFLAYVNSFYNPLRQLASFWANFQTAMAGWDRIAEILALDTDMATVADGVIASTALLEFSHVSFHYADGKEVLRDIQFRLEAGKTYAFVGPTGGGKTTTASLMARLFDPTGGGVFFQGKDLRGYPSEERTRKIGFILQEPFLFAGSVLDNILYGDPAHEIRSTPAFNARMAAAGLEPLLPHIEGLLDVQVTAAGDALSLGQRQLIAFIRAVLRQPELLILDEATANIDTVTEKLLEQILAALPPRTTKVVIAHRLNTIEHADEIFFVNAGSVTPAGSFDHAVELLMQDRGRQPTNKT